MRMSIRRDATPNDIYRQIMAHGQHAGPRGQRVMECHAVQMEFGPEDWFIESEYMPIKLDYVRNELLWYWQGNRDATWISNHAKIWNDCISDYGRLHSNYGYYFNDALPRLLRQFQSDLDTRQAVININRPEHHYPGNKDVPCTMYIGFTYRNLALHTYVHMRSQDAVFGLRNDLPAFQMFKLKLAELMGVVPGRVFLNVDNLHVYERHFDMVNDAYQQDSIGFGPMPFDPYIISDLHAWIGASQSVGEVGEVRGE